MVTIDEAARRLLGAAAAALKSWSSSVARATMQEDCTVAESLWQHDSDTQCKGSLLKVEEYLASDTFRN